MEHECEKIEANEDIGVHFRLQAGVFRALCDNDAAEAEVYSCGEEGGGDGETDEITGGNVSLVMEDI